MSRKPEIVWAVTNFGITVYPTIAETRKQSIASYGEGFQEKANKGWLKVEKFKLSKVPKFVGSKIIKEIMAKNRTK